MKLSFYVTSAVLAASVAVGCAHASAPPEEHTTTTAAKACCGKNMQGAQRMQGMHGQHGMMCPMAIPGTTVSAVETSDGAALEYKTTGDVADLRARVHRMADMHDHGGCPMMPQMATPPSTASVEDIEGGARIVFRPKDTMQIRALREHVRNEAAEMRSGCPMMH